MTLCQMLPSRHEIDFVAAQAIDLSRGEGGEFLLEEINDHFDDSLGTYNRDTGLLDNQINKFVFIFSLLCINCVLT
jgi:hypothetical protein